MYSRIKEGEEKNKLHTEINLHSESKIKNCYRNLFEKYFQSLICRLKCFNFFKVYVKVYYR